jgi:DNA-binding beta-propeller fold protein YncE
VTTDAAGNVYVADREKRSHPEFDSSGSFLTRFGQTGTADGQFTRPTDVAVGNGGTVYVADQYNDRIQSFVCP